MIGEIVAVVLGVGLAFAARRALAGPEVFAERVVTWRAAAPQDAIWLARVALLEAGRGSDEELGAIMWVAINRAQIEGVPVRDVVETTAWPGGGARGRAFVEAVGAPGGVGYQSEFGHSSPLDHPRYGAALAYAEDLLAGRHPNRIGARTHFVHPQSLPRCAPGDAVPSGRLCVDGRAFPAWSVARSRGGSAEFEPLRVGRAVFS